MGNWNEAHDPEGRVYYYNSESGETTWDKPRELYSELELQLEKHGWKTGETEGGKLYYYNESSGESRWEVPTFESDEKEEAVESTQEVAQDITQPVLKPLESYSNQSPIAKAVVLPRSEAEQVFMDMLKSYQIDSTWSFNKIISELSCKDPRYWCIDDDPLWKRQMFEKYLSNRSEDELLKEHSAVSKFKDAFVAMLSQNKDIHYYSRWSTAKRMFANEPIYKHSVISEKIKRQVFQDFVDELRKKHFDGREKIRQQATSELQDYLDGIMPNKSSLLSWQELSSKYLFENSTRFTSNKHFQLLTKHDVLKQYISIVERYESQCREQLEKIKAANYTRDRIARDQFKNLLSELSSSIRCNSKWENVYPLFKSDKRFVATLGRNGSSPLDMFLDVVEEKTMVMKAQKSIANQILIDANYQWSSDRDENKEQLTKILSGHQQLESLDAIDCEILVSKLLDDYEERQAQEAEMIVRLLEQRKKYFTLLLQRLYNSPTSKPATWEEAQEQLKGYHEYVELEDNAVKEKLFTEFEPLRDSSLSTGARRPPPPAPKIPRKRQMTPVELDY